MTRMSEERLAKRIWKTIVKKKGRRKPKMTWDELKVKTLSGSGSVWRSATEMVENKQK